MSGIKGRQGNEGGLSANGEDVDQGDRRVGGLDNKRKMGRWRVATIVIFTAVRTSGVKKCKLLLNYKLTKFLHSLRSILTLT